MLLHIQLEQFLVSQYSQSSEFTTFCKMSHVYSMSFIITFVILY